MSTADFTSKTVKQQMTQSTGKLNLKAAEKARVDLTAEQQKQIKGLYSKAAAKVMEQAKDMPTEGSKALKQQYLFNLSRQLKEETKRIEQELEGQIKGAMYQVSSSVIKDNQKFLDSVGMPSGGAFSHVPDQVVRAVATGQLYEGNWSLSKALWKTTKKTQADIQTIVATGIAEQKSSYDIAKDLEKYLNPDAVKEWDWSKVYPGTARKVDFNAQRLARTMVSHAYEQAFVQTTQKNPFVTKYKWLSSGGERMCEICEQRNNQLYDKDDLPLDHPMGMCTFEAVIPDSMVDISNRIADWKDGKADPELDNWATHMGYYLTNKPSNPVSSVPYDFESYIQSKYGDAQPGTKKEAKRYAEFKETMDRVFRSGTPKINVTEDALFGILDEGRVRSCFETMKRRGEALDTTSMYLQLRKDLEERMFGVPKDLPNKDRPIYGYLQSFANRGEQASVYGGISLILDMEKISPRVTWTAADSYSTDEYRITPSPWGKVNYNDWSSGLMKFGGYMELQIHGGVSLSDISGISYTKGSLSEETLSKLKAFGLEVFEQ